MARRILGVNSCKNEEKEAVLDRDSWGCDVGSVKALANSVENSGAGMALLSRDGPRLE